MNYAFVLIFTACSLFISCTKDSSSIEKVVSEEEYSRLKDYHGKYKIISSYSNFPLDMNHDNQSSFNLLDELLEVNNTNLQIRIPKRDEISKSKNCLFEQFWPEQYLSYDGKSYEGPSSPANADVSYVLQAVVHQGQITDSTIILYENPLSPTTLYKGGKIITVIVERNDRIKVMVERSLLTPLGWKEVRIESVYQKVSENL